MREAIIQHDSQINKDKLQKELNRGKPNNKSKFTSGLLWGGVIFFIIIAAVAIGAAIKKKFES